ncbi:MAG TPA: hypothetical protein VGF28_26115 [Thermoanaerobaculia bacterium]
MIFPLLLLAAVLHAGPERSVAPPTADASPYGQLVRDVAAGDDLALIVWEEDYQKFAAARVDRDGRRLDARPIVLAIGDQAARGRGNWLVIGHRDSKITGQLVSEDGTAGAPFTIGEADVVERVRVAFDGTHFLVVWNLTHAFRAARLDANGNIVERGIEYRANIRYNELELVALPKGFAVVTLHHDFVTRLEFTVEVFRFNTNADFLSYGWLDRTSSATVSDLHAVAHGDAIVATWRAERVGAVEVFLAREGQPLRIVAQYRTPLDLMILGGKAHVVIKEPHWGEISLVPEDGTAQWTWPTALHSVLTGSFGDRALLAATTNAIHSDVFTAVVNAPLDEVVPVELLALDPALQERPSVARGPNGQSLVVWIESRQGESASLVGARLDRAGRPLDAQPFVIGEGLLRAPWFPRPQVASDGESWLVVWNENGAVRSRRVLQDGTLAGTAAKVAATGYENGEVCVAWNGREYLAGYVAVAPLKAYMIPISRENVPGAATRLSADGAPYAISCAAAGGDTLFVWTSDAIEGTVVRADGSTTGIVWIGEGRSTTVASDGERFAVAWDYGGGWDNLPYVVDWAMVSRQGLVTMVAEPPVEGERPALAGTRDGFLLAWDDGDVYALELDSHGSARGERVVVSAAPGLREVEVALAGGDVPLAVYMRELPSSLEGRFRIFARTLSEASGPRRRVVRH